MNEILAEPQLNLAKDYLEKHLGLHYTEMRSLELSRKLKNAARAFGYEEVSEFLSWLIKKPVTQRNLERLASFLTIGETYFLREKEAFEYFLEIYLKQRSKQFNTQNKKLFIWSAGCSSGEEVYSLAGIIREKLYDSQSWDIRILGTDINPRSLEKAEKGIYTKWSFRNTPSWFMNKYVQELSDGKFEVKAELKQMVEFKYHNLATNFRYYEQVDAIFCRNVLIYFSQKLINKVTSRMYDALSEGGIMLLSPVEVSLNICQRFIRCYYSGRTFFCKKLESTELFIHNGIDINLPELSAEDIQGEQIGSEDEFERIWFLYKEGLYLRVEYLIKQKYKELGELPADYRLLLGYTYFNQGRFAEAESLFSSNADEQAGTVDYFLLAGRIKLEQRQYKEALGQFERVLEKDAQSIEALYFSGIACNKIGEKELSREKLTRALQKLKESSGFKLGYNKEAITAEDINHILQGEPGGE